jgi:hypothetical protein
MLIDLRQRTEQISPLSTQSSPECLGESSSSGELPPYAQFIPFSETRRKIHTRVATHALSGTCIVGIHERICVAWSGRSVGFFE